MSKKYSNVTVKAKHCGNNVERMIRRFIKKTKKEKILEEVRERRYYKKPSEVRRDKIRKSDRLKAREARKEQAAVEKRRRNNK
jgi:ribosomal protein S21|tara:strand:- start:2075 stop:2323 length:249 start_codon:yes stop_codon:yes gene_type:complete